MNNQAAQTMPERALAAWTGKHRTDAENRAFLAGYETCQSDANAAALSQTAGVASLQQWERTSMETLAAALRERGDDLSTDSASWLEKWLAAAPAASGGEDDEAPKPTAMQIRYAEGYSDGVRDTERIAKERESSAASVSERARAIITETIGYEFGTGSLQPVNDHDMGNLAAAIEQALTQQRDGDVAALTSLVAELRDDQREDEKRAHENGGDPVTLATATVLRIVADKIQAIIDTTPQPGAEGLRESVVPGDIYAVMRDSFTNPNPKKQPDLFRLLMRSGVSSRNDMPYGLFPEYEMAVAVGNLLLKADSLGQPEWIGFDVDKGSEHG